MLSVWAADTFDRYGLMVRRQNPGREVYLLFSADSMFEGAPYALDVMAEKGVKGSFFFTGNFLRDTAHAAIVRRIIAEGHFVGPHSDGHILLSDWADGRPSLVPDDSLERDTERNYALLEAFGVTDRSWYLPPFEWAGASHCRVLRRMGLTPIAPSPGIMIFRDYTTPDMDDYWSSDSMLRQLWDFEAARGLDGTFLIIHLGTQDVRTDKLYHHLPAILDSMSARGYKPVRLP